MTREETLYCMKANSVLHSETCEECPLYGDTGVDHCFEDAIDEVIKALEQRPCEDVHDINIGNIYECSCGYGWDKSKVVRHHFCPNCGAKMIELQESEEK